jgi:hypothetical protein
MTDKSRGEILLYKAEDGNAKLEVRLERPVAQTTR